jgi:excisionase family DNA binding protein
MQNGLHEKNLTVSEAAEALGLRAGTMRAWILRRKIGYLKIGRAVRIPESTIRRILEASFVPPRNGGQR